MYLNLHKLIKFFKALEASIQVTDVEGELSQEEVMLATYHII